MVACLLPLADPLAVSSTWRNSTPQAREEVKYSKETASTCRTSGIRNGLRGFGFRVEVERAQHRLVSNSQQDCFLAVRFVVVNLVRWHDEDVLLVPLQGLVADVGDALALDDEVHLRGVVEVAVGGFLQELRTERHRRRQRWFPCRRVDVRHTVAIVGVRVVVVRALPQRF